MTLTNDSAWRVIEIEMSSTMTLSNGAIFPGPFSKGVSRIASSEDQIPADKLARHHAESHLQEIPLIFHLEDATKRYLVENPKEVVGHEYDVACHFSIVIERSNSADGVRREQVSLDVNRTVM